MLKFPSGVKYDKPLACRSSPLAAIPEINGMEPYQAGEISSVSSRMAEIEMPKIDVASR